MAKKKKTEESQSWHLSHHDTTPYGKPLAEKVAVYLEQGNVIAYAHRDYCGMGLLHWNGAFYYGSVNDGYMLFMDQKFDSKKIFIEWLSAQSDDSLYGKEEESWVRDNQRITKERLETAILEKNEGDMGIYSGSGDTWETIKP